MRNQSKNIFSKIRYWRRYAFEFLSMFIAVVAAFALDNWNENRRDHLAEIKILSEISNGLGKDIDDVDLNISGHEKGIRAVNYWRDIIKEIPRKKDSVEAKFHFFLRDFVLIQNISGYETLKSKGLELVENDSLRYKIITLYEYDYNALRKLEEEYNELQFHKNYFKDFNRILSPHFQFDSIGKIQTIKTPIVLSPKDQNLLLSYLWKINLNRQFILTIYADVKKKIGLLKKSIDKEIKDNS